jgi:hypothetical protein
MKTIFEFLLEVMARRAHAHAIEQLDERTLRDIGMDLEANRARERTRLAMRFGMY